MRRRCTISAFAALFVLCLCGIGSAEVKLTIEKTLKPEGRILDVAISASGKRIYVLSDQMAVHVYDGEGKLLGVVSVDKATERIQMGPQEDVLILTSQGGGFIQIATVDLIQDINVTGSPLKGPAEASVVMAVFSDFQCPYCSRVAPLLGQVLEKYPNDVKLVFKHFPLRSHRFALKAALAAVAAHRQGRFWDFHDRLFQNYNRLNEEKIQEISTELSLDQERFQNDMRDPQIKAIVQKDLEDGTRAGVGGTPTVFLNGKRLRSLNPQEIQKAVGKLLGKTRKGSEAAGIRQN